MAENTKISWCDHTVNWWWGCTKVSPACKHCYAEIKDAQYHPSIPWMQRYQGEKATASHWGPSAPRLLRVDAARRELMKYERRAVREGCRFRIFHESMGDFFEDRRDLDTARLEALDAMRLTPHLDHLLLTKRPETILYLLCCAEREAPGTGLSDWLRNWIGGIPPKNIWLGTTVEDQPQADQRIPKLLKVPAAVRFLSCEPLLAPVDLLRVEWPNKGGHRVDVLRFGYWSDGPLGFVNHSDMHHDFGHPIDWVIVGGESGTNARLLHPDWARSLRDQCAFAGTPFLFKQWGEWLPDNQNPRIPDPSGATQACKVGKARAGRLLDGVLHDAFPEGRP